MARYGSAPTREGETDQLSPVARAAWYVEDAFGGTYAADMAERTVAQRDAYVRYEGMVHPERLVCVVVLSIVSLIEVPLWCLRGHQNLFWVGGSNACRAPGPIYLSGVAYAPAVATMLVEAVALGYLATLCRMEMGFGRPRDAKLRTRVLATGAAALDLVVFALGLALGTAPMVRLGPYLRVLLFAANTKEVWAAGRACLTMVPSLLDVSFLLALCVCFFGWLAAITLDDVTTEADGLPVNEGFDGLGRGIYTMFFVSTTANFPDQMLASYASSRAFGLFFAFYVLLACFVFLNLILAVVYNEYSASIKNEVRGKNERRVASLQAAFALLSEAGAISRPTFEELVKETNRVEKLPQIKKEEVDFFFSILDDDRSGTISKAEFFDFVDILQYSFTKVRTSTYLERHRETWAASRLYESCRTFVHSPRFATTTTCVLVANTMLVFAESWLDLSDTLKSSGEEAFAVAECVFSIVYMALLGCQLCVVPFDEFWLAATNRFDAFVTTLLFCVAFLWALPFISVSRATLHRLTILRLLRLVARLRDVPRFRLVCACIARIIPASAGAVGLLFCTSSLWNAAGVQLFGGGVYEGNPRLEGTSYQDAHYDVLNFNDFANGYVPLFAMVATGGPFTEFIDMAYAVTGLRGLGCLYFVSFYVVGCLVAVNVFSAFVIDAFLSQYEEGRVLQGDAEAATLDQSRAGDGYRIVCIRHSARDDVYKAMFLDGDS